MKDVVVVQNFLSTLLSTRVWLTHVVLDNNGAILHRGRRCISRWIQKVQFIVAFGLFMCFVESN